MYLMIRKKQHIKFKELIIITAENCNLIITILYKEAINIKTLTRSKNDKIFSGVLGGLGGFFNVNPLFLRIIYAALALSSFLTWTVIYIIASAIIPLEGNSQGESPNYNNKTNTNSFLGISLIALGIVFLANNFLPIYFPEILSTIRYYSRKLIDFWPVLFIILGIYLLLDKKNNQYK